MRSRSTRSPRRTTPCSGWSRPAIARRTVDLPLPEGPNNATERETVWNDTSTENSVEKVWRTSTVRRGTAGAGGVAAGVEAGSLTWGAP